MIYYTIIINIKFILIVVIVHMFIIVCFSLNICSLQVIILMCYGLYAITKYRSKSFIMLKLFVYKFNIIDDNLY